MAPTPDIQGQSADVFSNFSTDSTIIDDQTDYFPQETFVEFDINCIPRSPQISIYGLHTPNRYPPDADDTYDDDVVGQHVPFNPNRYPDGANGSMYMSLPSSPPRTKSHY